MRNKFSYLLCFLVAALLFSCRDFEIETPVTKEDGAFYINYSIEDKLLTYSVNAEDSECELSTLYCFFFSPKTATGGGKYRFYKKIEINDNADSGLVKINMQDKNQAQADWQILAVANLDQYVNLEGAANTDSWLTTRLSIGSTDIEQAKGLIKIFASNTTGLQTPLPMSAEARKVAGARKIDLKLQRRAARIDISNGAEGFVIESVELRNVRRSSPLWGHVLQEAGETDAWTNYDPLILNSTEPELRAALYCLPNFVADPESKGDKTTMLIVKGRLNHGPSSFYRININNKGKLQNLRPNGIYVVNITRVKSEGAPLADTADNENIEYYINERSEQGEGASTFDQEGNKLTVSKRLVSLPLQQFSTDQVEVICLPAATGTSISDPWSFIVAGADKAKFTVVKETSPSAQEFLKITTKQENTSDKDWQAVVMVKWGQLSQAVFISQTGKYSSSAEGVSVSPNPLILPGQPTSSATEIKANLIVQLNDILPSFAEGEETAFIQYEGEGAELINWLSLSNPVYSAASGGTLSYTLTATQLPSTINIRRARFLFSVKSGARVWRTEAQIVQSDMHFQPTVRKFELRQWEKRYGKQPGYRRKDMTPHCYSDYHGFEAIKTGENDLQFSLSDKDYTYYKLIVYSNQAWSITPGANVGARFEFLGENGSTKWTGTGESALDFVTIKASKDLSDLGGEQSDHSFQGSFTLSFEDGTMETIKIYQEAITQYMAKGCVNTAEYSSHTPYPSSSQWVGGAGRQYNGTYFYKTRKINNITWLDRPIGASSADWFDYGTGSGNLTVYNKWNGNQSQRPMNSEDYDPYTKWKNTTYNNKIWLSDSWNELDCPKGFHIIDRSVLENLNSGLDYITGDNGKLVAEYNDGGTNFRVCVAGYEEDIPTSYFVCQDDRTASGIDHELDKYFDFSNIFTKEARIMALTPVDRTTLKHRIAPVGDAHKANSAKEKPQFVYGNLGFYVEGDLDDFQDASFSNPTSNFADFPDVNYLLKRNFVPTNYKLKRDEFYRVSSLALFDDQIVPTYGLNMTALRSGYLTLAFIGIQDRMGAVDNSFLYFANDDQTINGHIFRYGQEKKPFEINYNIAMLNIPPSLQTSKHVLLNGSYRLNNNSIHTPVTLLYCVRDKNVRP